jgi:hypothetical protein
MAQDSLTAFASHERLLSGPPADVATALWERARRAPADALLIFDDATGAQVDLDLSGSEEMVRARHAPQAPQAAETAARAGAGRPKLGVVAREVTLLPRHWDWLKAQSGGASAAIRRLVDEARRREPEGEDPRSARDAAYRFMSAIAGNLPGFEEAARALFAGDAKRLRTLIGGWPPDVRDHALRLARIDPAA